MLKSEQFVAEAMLKEKASTQTTDPFEIQRLLEERDQAWDNAVREARAGN